MANIGMACVVMAYMVMAYIVIAYIVMAYIVMAHIVDGADRAHRSDLPQATPGCVDMHTGMRADTPLGHVPQTS